MNTNKLPLTIETGRWRGGHIQGITLDKEKGFLYCSFTTELVKLDLSGNVIGSVKGFTGHLGCLAMGTDGRIWGSLEYKNDVIGKGILQNLGIDGEVTNAFYVAIFDGDKITERDMNAEKDGIMKTVWLREPTEDYLAEWEENGKTTTSCGRRKKSFNILSFPSCKTHNMLYNGNCSATMYESRKKGRKRL